MINLHFDPNNILMDRRTKTILVLNPKVLTTFCRALYRDGVAQFRDDPDPSEGRWRIYPRARNFPVPSLGMFLNVLRGAPDYAVYAIVRNPYRRVLSGWKDKFFDPHHAGGGASAAYPRSMRQGELAKFRKAARQMGLAGGAEGALLPFDTFLQVIAQQPEGRRNHHWDTQVSVLQHDHFRFTRTYRLEDQRDLACTEIFGRMGFEREWILERAAKPLNKSSALVAGYSAEQAMLVENLFARDFARFGYAPECPPDLKG